MNYDNERTGDCSFFWGVNMENNECFTKYCLHMKNGEKIVMLEEKDIDYEECIINEFSKNDNKMIEIHDVNGNIAYVPKSEICFINVL